MLFRPSIRSEAYATATVQTWLEENSQKIKLFHLPSYSPELNPDEYLNRDVKASLAEKKRPRTAKAQKADVVAHLSARKNEPESSGGYFTRRKCVMPLTDTDINPGQHNKPKFAS